MKHNLDAAITYVEDHECSVIPVRQDKRPYIAWAPYQKKRPNKKELEEWWKKWPQAMVGIVNGSISGLV